MTRKSQIKVLVVDDNRSYRQLLEGYFTSLGWWVISAEDIQTATNYIDQHFFHAAIVDIRLREEPSGANEDGLELLDHLKNTGEPTGTMIITGYPTGERYRRAFRDIGVIDFFEKRTLRKEEIVGKVGEAFEEADRVLREQRSKLSLRDYHQGLDIQEFERELLRKPSQGIFEILKRLLNPAFPFKISDKHQRIDTSGLEPIFETHYWSRWFGKALRIRIGKMTQVRKEYQSLKRKGADVFIETIDDLSGIRNPVDDFYPSDFL